MATNAADEGGLANNGRHAAGGGAGNPDTANPNAMAAEAAVAAETASKAAIAAAVAADPNLETATLALPKDALDYLRREAERRGVSTGDMVRIAIGTQKFLTEKAAAGAKIQLKDSSGTFDLAV